MEQRLVLGDRQRAGRRRTSSPPGRSCPRTSGSRRRKVVPCASPQFRRREDALERDAEVQTQVRHHVVVRLAAADVRDRRRSSVVEVGGRARRALRDAAEHVAGRAGVAVGLRSTSRSRGAMCVGISAMVTVCAVLAAGSPSVSRRRRGSAPGRAGSGRAKVVCPLPPYVVPSSANSAWFWLMGSNWPLHSAQPFGGKLKLTSSGSRRGTAQPWALTGRTPLRRSRAPCWTSRRRRSVSAHLAEGEFSTAVVSYCDPA